VITSVTVERFRGIREGSLDTFAPLTVLVGPNGSGKSTVLDALLIGAGARPAEAIGRCVKRRAAQEPSATWLFHRQNSSCALTVNSPDASRRTAIEWRDEQSARILLAGNALPNLIGAAEATLVVRQVAFSASSQISSHWVAFSSDNEFIARSKLEGQPPAADGRIELVDLRGVAHGADPLHDVLSRALRRGAKKPVIELLKQVLPADFEDLQVATENSIPSVHLVTASGSVPVSHAGDGVRGLVRVALSLGALEDGVALVEEPEVHQHPAALRQTARALVAAAARGIQTIVATHSLELIDDMVLESQRLGFLDSFSVVRLGLRDGVLSNVATRGSALATVRTELEVELR
jgi:hypothetical protein